uniref:Large ribosomal RNA subunit accumulation protein YceD n=1 Tax=Candidatus Kentrum sp. MB TaxID=2138164 RepID=A0A450XDN6_9GAMM|nr:MAG: uncharacterized protein BECKMB1821G_GA0114241_102728 [Candidatus Kentron sp. MB]VFK33590.1 MAG: uncharacterized protein BECKMB1821I_GA0114274_10496 [Candidatus Kentron sp. MB]VFK76269.1 MAG: uncharacterized protein BECKMB1821H_GA0114242_10497 [Candidatus Kentron sp. MB]
MLQDLPELIYPLRFARTRYDLCGHIALAGMHRLRPLLAAEGGDARIELRFGPDDLGRPSIRGLVRAELNLVCQRCLRSMLFSAESNVRLNMISSDKEEIGSLAEYISPGFEPLVVIEDEAMVLSDIIEDELLLALPAIPRHSDGVCEIEERYSVREPVEHNRKKPFAVLENLMEWKGRMEQSNN